MYIVAVFQDKNYFCNNHDFIGRILNNSYLTE